MLPVVSVSVSDMYVANPVDNLGERIPVQIDITVAMDCQCRSTLVTLTTKKQA